MVGTGCGMRYMRILLRFYSFFREPGCHLRRKVLAMCQSHCHTASRLKNRLTSSVLTELSLF